MSRTYKEFQNYHKRGKLIVALFFLNFLFLYLALFSFLFPWFSSQIPSFLFLIISSASFLLALLQLKRNIEWVKTLEIYFLNNSYGTSISRIKRLHKLLDENLFEYHFQPIIDAKTGDIFAYEALMRTDSNINMLPLEILDLAAKENRLYDIEKLTFHNTLKIMKENSDTFSHKKLFINSISSHPLKDSDFNFLYQEYGSMFESVVIEITEATLLEDSGIKSIQSRLREVNCQLALDDYGTGYSNESNLLKTNPNYVKIDRTILRFINLDSKKQHLVSNLVDFALHNNIKIIAEGIETYEEFEYVINVGVDYIQGFYTARPTPVLISNIPNEFTVAILDLNHKKLLDNMAKKIYEVTNDTDLFPVSLALEQYSDILIRVKEITLHGNQGMVANLSLIVPDNMKCTIIFDHVNLRGNECPTITLGNNCRVVINLIGDSTITNDGIRVPESSDLTFVGDGNLSIHADRANGVGIGGTYVQSFGNITFAATGTIKILHSGDTSIGIGGTQNINSLLHFASGNVTVETTGYYSVGIGSISGIARVKIGNCKIKIYSEATKIVGIGCLKGIVDIESYGELDIKCEGRNAIGIGVIDEGSGAIKVLGGIVRIDMNARNGAGIGALGGIVNINIQDGDIHVYAEGTNIVGIGDQTGSGDIKIHNGILSTELYSACPTPIGNKNNKIIIDGGNIQCDFPEGVKPVNSYGTPLTARFITSKLPFLQLIEGPDYSYTYEARYSDRFPLNKVYLPEDI